MFLKVLRASIFSFNQKNNKLQFVRYSNFFSMSTTDSLSAYEIIFEDSSVLVVNKPCEMLSVPGKVEDRVVLPRYVEWERSVDEALDFCKNHISIECSHGLSSLQKYKNIPRKKKSFFGYVERTLKISDLGIIEEMWEAIVKTDRMLHKIPLSSRPANFVSVVELAEEKSGKLFSVHRLDCATSGVLLLAKDEGCSAHICEQFRDRKVSKTYIAEVSGHLSSETLLISLPIRPDLANRPMQVVDLENGKAAETLVKILCYRPADASIATASSQTDDSITCSDSATGDVDGTTVVQLTPVTGRTHQLRLHLAAVGHPILGDTLYATVAKPPPLLLSPISASSMAPPLMTTDNPSSGSSSDALQADVGASEYWAKYPTLRLHALSLTVLHPVLNVPVVFRALPCPFFHPAHGDSEELHALFEPHKSLMDLLSRSSSGIPETIVEVTSDRCQPPSSSSTLAGSHYPADETSKVVSKRFGDEISEIDSVFHEKRLRS